MSLPQEVEADEEAEEVPDWLSELNPGAKAEPEPAAEAPTGSALNWLNKSPVAMDASESDADADAEMPDWLSELEPEAGDAEDQAGVAEETQLDTEFSWMSDEALGALESAPAATSEAEPEPEEEAEAVASESPDWLTELEPEAEAESSTEGEAEVVPDWLSELEPDGVSSEAEPAAAEADLSESDFGWLEDDWKKKQRRLSAKRRTGCPSLSRSRPAKPNLRSGRSSSR